MHRIAVLFMIVAGALVAQRAGAAEPLGESQERARLLAAALLAAYPDALERIDGNDLVWRDGTRMVIDDGKGEKPFDEWLAHPDIADMLRFPYATGAAPTPPAKDVDPGRARNAAFFDKVYGDCRKGEVEKNLTSVAWVPKRGKQKLPFNRANRAAAALEAVSKELDETLPQSFDVYLVPSAGTYNCRVIAGTDRVSAHGHGIAIDIALKHSHYWRNAAPGADGAIAFKNEIPMEIVRVFEKHGFIWGGRWYHYDTMHFEYRPEFFGARGAGK